MEGKSSQVGPFWEKSLHALKPGNYSEVPDLHRPRYYLFDHKEETQS